MAGMTLRAAPRRGGGWLLAGGYARHPSDAVRLVAGCVIVLLTALAIHKDYVGIREMAVFRLVNSLALPGWTWPGCAAGSGHQTGQRPGTRNTPAATAGARQVLLDDQVLAFPALQ